MSFSYSFDLLSTLEIVGIVLAVIGFFNLSEKLENTFAGIQRGFYKIAKFEIETAKEFWPLHKNIKRLLIEMLKDMPWLLVILLIFIIWKDAQFLLWDAFMSLSVIEKVFVCVGLMIGLILNELFTQYFITSFIGLIAKFCEKLFHILAKPSSGITGSLGLLISVVSFSLSRITSTTI